MVCTDCIAHDSIGEGFWLGMGTGCGCVSCTAYGCGTDRTSKAYTGIQNAGSAFTVACGCIDFYLLDCIGYNCPGGTSIASIEFVVAEGDQPLRTVIDGCTFYRSGSNNDMLLMDEGLDSSITNNLLYALSGGNYLVRLGMSSTAPSTDSLYYHNTFDTDNVAAQQIFYCYYGTGMTFKNNIYSVRGGSGYAYMVTTNAQTGFVSDYNQWDSCGVSKWGASWYNLANWRTTTGQDANTIANNPVFITPGTDYHLQVTSPCIAAGDPAVGVLVDKDNVTRGAAVDMGAYEYI